MAVLLYISASPKGEASVSNKIAEAFLAEYQRHNPADEIRRLPLFESDLPDFGAVEAEAKFAPIFGQELQAHHVEAWSKVVACIDTFKAADKVVISTPMWNFSVPYRLKQYFDIIVQPRLTFSYDPQKMMHYGLLENRPVQVIITRSSVMPGDFGDFQTPWLKFILEYIGLRDLRFLTAWQTTGAIREDRLADYVERYAREAEVAAAQF